jgi:phosphatidate cytidylyltransferase
VLRARVASATPIVVGTLLAVVAGGWLFALAALVVALLALDELMVMLAHAGRQPARLLGHLLVVLLFLVALAGLTGPLLTAAVTLVILAPLLHVMWRRSLTGTMLDWAVSVAATLYIGWLAAHALPLRALGMPPGLGPFLQTDLPALIQGHGLAVGAIWTLTAILTTWASDTAAFFAGRAWGRHQLTPLLSPKKTWEGAAAGLTAATATTLACALVLGLPLSPLLAVAAGLLLGLVAQLGDLAESLLKRQTGVKDAGSAIPGHGGVLDRIDSLLFVLPAAYYLASLVGSG